MDIHDLGLISYQTAEAIQAEAVQRVQTGGEEVLFLLEHPPVITFGRNGGEEHLPLPREAFLARGIDVAQSTRGGSITCHFPDQLVAYPVLRVDKRPGGLKRLFHDLEECAIRTLARCNVMASRSEGRPGVWVDERKIASIGIAVKRWVTCHGLSLNVGKDLSLFTEITPCGLPGVSTTSLHLERGDETVSMGAVKKIFCVEFFDLFTHQSKKLA